MTLTRTMFTLSTFFVAITLLAGPGEVLAQTNDARVGQQVMALEKARWEAVVAADVKKVGEMLADDLLYIHASGYTQTKKEYLDTLAAKQLVYHSYALKDTTAHAYGPVVVTHGKFAYETLSKGQELKGEAFYTGIYHEKNGTWQLVSWQTTKIVP